MPAHTHTPNNLMPINNDGLAKDPYTHLHTGELPSICLGYAKRIAQV